MPKPQSILLGRTRIYSVPLNPVRLATPCPPRERPEDWPPATQPLLTAFWQARIARQTEIDASNAAEATSEPLYDKPHEDKKTVGVAGPFTVESLSPHRMLGMDEDDELIDPYKSLKTTLKAEINSDAWATLHSDTSRPFDLPNSGRIAVKVINHLGDEVMKVFRV